VTTSRIATTTPSARQPFQTADADGGPEVRAESRADHLREAPRHHHHAGVAPTRETGDISATIEDFVGASRISRCVHNRTARRVHERDRREAVDGQPAP